MTEHSLSREREALAEAIAVEADSKSQEPDAQAAASPSIILIPSHCFPSPFKLLIPIHCSIISLNYFYDLFMCLCMHVHMPEEVRELGALVSCLVWVL